MVVENPNQGRREQRIRWANVKLEVDYERQNKKMEVL